MDPNQPDQNGNNTGDNRQAIFSSPAAEPVSTPQPTEPVVDDTVAPQPIDPVASPQSTAPSVTPPAPESIPEPTPVSNSTSTETPSANPEPTSMPGIIASAPTIATPAETGDIILSPDNPKSHNKRPFIIGGIIIIAILAITGVVLLAMGGFGNNKYTEAEVREKWEEYAGYLEQGPDGYESTNSNGFIEEAGHFSVSDEDQEDFTREARSLYKDFVFAANNSPYRKNADLLATVDNYTIMVNAILTYIDSNLASRNLINVLVKDGESKALDGVNQILPSTNNIQVIDALSGAMKAYYDTKIQLYAFYKENLCLLNGEPDDLCSEFLGDDATLEQLLRQFDSSKETMLEAYEKAVSELKDYNKIIGEQLSATS